MHSLWHLLPNYPDCDVGDSGSEDHSRVRGGQQGRGAEESDGNQCSHSIHVNLSDDDTV
jgi:hypothetical protein